MPARSSTSRLSLSFAALALCLTASAHAAPHPDDASFSALREAARRNDAGRVHELSARLAQYPIPSYVEYYRLRSRLVAATRDEIRDFRSRHAGSAIGDRLRNDWLLELGRTRDWATFDEQYPQFVLNDDLQLKCHAAASKLAKGEKPLDEARRLLVSPKDYGDACTALIGAMVQAGLFGQDDVWAQMRLAAENGQLGVMRRLSNLAGTSEARLTQAMDKPTALLGKLESGRPARETFIIALGRVARSDVEQASQALQRHAAKLSRKEQAQAWAQIALQSSLKTAPDAADVWRRTEGAELSPDAQQWKARSALRVHDWKMVAETVSNMPPVLQADPTWIYWKGRALKVQGRVADAEASFRSISSQTNFYGQLATEELGGRIVLPPQAALPSEEEIARMAANPGFARALKFLELDMRFEATREWNWQLRGMSDRECLAAAEYARRVNLLDRMISSSDRTKKEFDFTQRFPSPHSDLMIKATEPLKLDRSWVYGLIRQESRFVQAARSVVGASGLMQVMPATAKYVAKKTGMLDYEPSRLNDLQVNVQLGTRYLAMVLSDLEGSLPMATAAYNAGPGRPRAWRSTLTRSVEGAIFAETIPFSETRNYVKTVLSNATYYAALFEGKPQSLRERLGTVAPKGYPPSSPIEGVVAVGDGPP